MKRNRIKIAACIFSVALLFVAVAVGRGGQKTDLTVVNATTQNPTVGNTINTTVGNTANQTTTVSKELSLQQLREIALKIIPGTIIKEKYDYENGGKVLEFDIIDKNGFKREVTLFASNGKVYDIDHDYDNQGNRFINKDLFEVNITFEQAQQIALKQVPGTVLAHKQDADYGLFIYEFIIRSNNGSIYEVDVETKNGTVIKVEIEDDYHPSRYGLPPVNLSGVNNTVSQVPQTQPINQSVTAPETVPQIQPEVVPPVQTPQVPQNSGNKTEAQLRQTVLAKFPGTVLYMKKDWDDGMVEYDYTIRQADGKVVQVEINSFGWITDVDYEGQYVNGVYYDWD